MSLKPLKPLKKVDHRPWYQQRAAYCVDDGAWRPLELKEKAKPRTPWEYELERERRARDAEQKANAIDCQFTTEHCTSDDRTSAIVIFTGNRTK